MDSIIEWLREMQDEYAPGGGGVQYHERYKEAADRLEKLEAALREIVDDGERMSGFQCKCVAMEALGIES